MIQGLKVTIKGDELKSLCEKRSAYHTERVGAYKQQSDTMEAAKVEGMNYSNGDPVRNLRDKQNQHQFEADEIAFIAAHLDVAETYILDGSDLIKLGICKRGW